MALIITEEMRSMIASAVVAGGYCTKDPHNGCLCCGDQGRANCVLIVGEEYADALQAWAHGELGCGFYTDDIRRVELGLEPIGDDREETYLERVGDLDVLHADPDLV
jgi:hypothetical protein